MTEKSKKERSEWGADGSEWIGTITRDEEKASRASTSIELNTDDPNVEFVRPTEEEIEEAERRFTIRV